MQQEPELFVPATSKRTGGGSALVLRVWAVLAIIVAGLVLVGYSQGLNVRGAIWTIGGFVIVWQLVAWIVRPVLTRKDEHR